MSIELHFNEEHGILVATINGELTKEDILAALKEIIASHQYPPDIDMLWDIQGVNFKKITSTLASAVVSVREKFPERGEANAAIFSPSDLGFGMTRMHQILSDELPQNISVFRDYQEAINWLKENKR